MFGDVTGALEEQAKSWHSGSEEGFLKEANSESKRKQKQRKGYQGKKTG